MEDVILKVENLSKQYRLGTLGTGSISHDLNRWWHTVRGKEDPYLKIGETNDRSKKGDSQYVWSLKDINFEVKKGDILGVIGKNGAGKSTLLKILSKVTGPTTGSIKTKGRIASLLEVGTGFHPEMTGKENVYLNGAILGMTKKEISDKIEEIIEFSGCERYINTPVKRYSSGMKVRLAFAVAAFLEPDILVVDEVLAVGDAEFQKKAIGKMKEISNGDGRTVLFVSHNMESIMSLCTKILVLKNGTFDFLGDLKEGVSHYLSDSNSEKMELPIAIKDAEIVSFERKGETDIDVSSVTLGSDLNLSIRIKNTKNFAKRINVRYQIFDEQEILVSTLNTYHQDKIINLEVGEEAKINCIIDKIGLSPSNYFIGIRIVDLLEGKELYVNDRFSKLEILNGDYFNSGRLPSLKNIGKFFLNFKWNIDK